MKTLGRQKFHFWRTEVRVCFESEPSPIMSSGACGAGAEGALRALARRNAGSGGRSAKPSSPASSSSLSHACAQRTEAGSAAACFGVWGLAA